jgi:hypothetical protein
MGWFTNLFAANTPSNIRFRGQGYTEEGALYHAEQRHQAWVRVLAKENKQVRIESKNITFLKKNDLVTTCCVDCSYSFLRR